MVLVLLLLILIVPATAETVEIVRDAYNNPHIFADTAAGAAFGAGYAQAEDRGDALLQNLKGPGDNVGKSIRDIAEAYAKGVNTYFREHPNSAAFEVSAGQVAGFAQHAYTSILGSNDLLLSGTRTTSHSVIAILDPVMNVNGPLGPYEMTLYAKKEDIAMAGVTPVGLPFPIVGQTQFLSVGWSGDAHDGGDRTLEEAWALMTSKTLVEAQRALALNQIRGHVLVGTTTGDIYDSLGTKPADGYLHRASPSPEADAVVKEALRVQTTWSFGRVQNLAFDTTIYQADEWQKMLAHMDPVNKLSRKLTNWNRRADVDSPEALAFYFFKLQLDRDAMQIRPPDSLSRQRVLAALDRTAKFLETKIEFNTKSNPTWDSTWGSTWGTLFRVLPEGTQKALALGGGQLLEVGIFTPRAWTFSPADPRFPTERRLAVSGPLVTRIVELSSKPTAVSTLDSGKGTTKRTFFRDRKELEKSSHPVKRLIFSGE